MKWRGRRQSGNVIDRRGARPRRGGFARRPTGLGSGRGIPLPTGRGGRLGLGGVLIVIAIIAAMYFLEGGPDSGTAIPPAQTTAAQEELKQFTAVVLADTEDVWNALFPETFGEAYSEPQLVLFTGAVDSGCGFASAAVGPFYCPRDRRVYLDLGFFEELKRRFGVPGDFAQAYVIAHEVGHHVQTLIGISARVQQAKQGLSQADANALSVRQELQADCFAGLWAKRADSMHQILDPGDISEALAAANAIGDDTLQKQAQGYAVPDSFTHGTSAERRRWFMAGYESGSPATCDTFSAERL